MFNQNTVNNFKLQPNPVHELASNIAHNDWKFALLVIFLFMFVFMFYLPYKSMPK